jgi:hypothetical protein
VAAALGKHAVDDPAQGFPAGDMHLNCDLSVPCCSAPNSPQVMVLLSYCLHCFACLYWRVKVSGFPNLPKAPAWRASAFCERFVGHDTTGSEARIRADSGVHIISVRPQARWLLAEACMSPVRRTNQGCGIFHSQPRRFLVSRNAASSVIQRHTSVVTCINDNRDNSTTKSPNLQIREIENRTVAG